MTQWTATRVSRLRRYWAAGLSATQIARLLGGITRNGVIGQANRLRLAPRSSGGRYDLANVLPSICNGLKELRDDPRSDPPEYERIPLANLNPRHCRWPYPGGMFCGRPTCARGHGAYCVLHAKRAYQPSPSEGARHDDADASENQWV